MNTVQRVTFLSRTSTGDTIYLPLRTRMLPLPSPESRPPNCEHPLFHKLVYKAHTQGHIFSRHPRRIGTKKRTD